MPEPSVRIQTITPAIARKWLDKNRDNNRNVVQSRVKQYAADMIAGRWELSDQAISFDEDDELVNGQHRLEAIILANKPIVSLVMFNLPTKAMLVLDSGKKRNTDEAFQVAGRDYPRQCGSTVRRVFMGMRTYAGRAFTDQEVDEFMAKHVDAVQFAHRILQKGKFASASIRAVIVRAYLKQKSVVRLEKFGEVLTTGMMVPGDEAAIHLRNFVMEIASSKDGKGRKHLYAMTQAAVGAFLKEEKIKKLIPAAEELFPIAGECEWAGNVSQVAVPKSAAV